MVTSMIKLLIESSRHPTIHPLPPGTESLFIDISRGWCPFPYHADSSAHLEAGQSTADLSEVSRGNIPLVGRP